MKIVSINKKGRNYRIKFENNSTLIIDQDLLSKYNLYEDLELSQEHLTAITEDSEYRKVYSSALRILSRRSHSVRELITKLKQKKYKENAIDRVIDRLVDLEYLNDEKFAKEYFDYAIERKKIGSIKIMCELKKRGVSSEFIKMLITDDNGEAFKKNATLLAEKKMNTLNIDKLGKEKIRQKLYSYLQQKGYETDIIYDVLNSMKF